MIRRQLRHASADPFPSFSTPPIPYLEEYHERRYERNQVARVVVILLVEPLNKRIKEIRRRGHGGGGGEASTTTGNSKERSSQHESGAIGGKNVKQAGATGSIAELLKPSVLVFGRFPKAFSACEGVTQRDLYHQQLEKQTEQKACLKTKASALTSLS